MKKNKIIQVLNKRKLIYEKGFLFDFGELITFIYVFNLNFLKSIEV